MLSNEALENLLHRPGISNQDRLLLCLAIEPLMTRPAGDIRVIALRAGWPGAKAVNISKYLGRARGLAIRTPDGWKLTDGGKAHVTASANLPKQAVPTALTQGLRDHLSKLANADTRSFVEESIRCAESGLRRAAVVLSWVGAVGVLYDHVVTKHLAAFNQEAVRRNAKWRAAKNQDDLARMEEHEFLQILGAISVLGKNVKQELEGCLKLRNACGHPNTLQVSDARVAGHIDTLLLNVFDRF